MGEWNEAVLYHLTSTRRLSSILRTGLKADDEGAIYAFTDLRAADGIAREQVFLARYAILEINPDGVTGEVLPDNVAERTAGYQRRVMQDRIEPKYLSHLCTRKTKPVDRREELLQCGVPPERVGEVLREIERAVPGTRITVDKKTGQMTVDRIGTK